jgi:hypothetical protein
LPASLICLPHRATGSVSGAGSALEDAFKFGAGVRGLAMRQDHVLEKGNSRSSPSAGGTLFRAMAWPRRAARLQALLARE